MTTSAKVEVYSIDSGISRFTVRAFASGMFSAFGHNPTLAIRDFEGEAKFSPDALDEARLVIRVNAKSLAVTDNMSDKDRRELEATMNQDVLETSKHPEITFESTQVSANKAGDGRYFVNLVGTLMLHGVSKSQAVAAQISLTGDMLRAHGEFTALQSAYGIKPVSVAGGALKVKDELKCSFDIVARKKVDNS
ncbi:MAG: YceI family protein [Bryobacteraceae bacterium]